MAISSLPAAVHWVAQGQQPAPVLPVRAPAVSPSPHCFCVASVMVSVAPMLLRSLDAVGCSQPCWSPLCLCDGQQAAAPNTLGCWLLGQPPPHLTLLLLSTHWATRRPSCRRHGRCHNSSPKAVGGKAVVASLLPLPALSPLCTGWHGKPDIPTAHAPDLGSAPVWLAHTLRTCTGVCKHVGMQARRTCTTSSGSDWSSSRISNSSP